MVLKLMSDINKINLEAFFNKLNKCSIEFFFVDKNCVYLYKEYPQKGKDNTQSSIISIMKEINISNYFLTPITELLPLGTTNDYPAIWCNERLNLDIELKINREKQPELQKMLNNIHKVREELLKIGGEDENGR